MAGARFGTGSSRRLIVGLALAASAAAGWIVMRPPTAVSLSLAWFLVNDDPSVVDWRVRTQWDLAERLTGDCMRGAGFRYVELPLPTAAGADGNLSPRDRVARSGFGATIDPDAPAVAEADPNMAYLESLPPARQDAYRAAFLGADTPADPGCQRAAQATIREPRANAIAAIDDLVRELAAAKAQDPLVQQGEAAWRACARAAGLPVGRQNVQSIGHDLFAARRSETVGPTGVEDPLRLAALQDEERRVALAIFTCDETFAHDTQPPTAAVERDWSTRHADRLAALRAELLRIDQDLKRAIETRTGDVGDA